MGLSSKKIPADGGGLKIVSVSYNFSCSRTARPGLGAKALSAGQRRHMFPRGSRNRARVCRITVKGNDTGLNDDEFDERFPHKSIF